MIPVVMLLISVYLVVAPIVDNPQIEYLYSIIFMLAGKRRRLSTHLTIGFHNH